MQASFFLMNVFVGQRVQTSAGARCARGRRKILSREQNTTTDLAQRDTAPTYLEIQKMATKVR